MGQSRKFTTLIVGKPAEHGALSIRLNNPARRNAIGPRMIDELLYALDDASADDSVRSIVLTGEGSAFCAGGDFGDLGGRSGQQGAQLTGGSDRDELPHRGDYVALMLAMDGANKPIVARVNGAAMGGGLGLVAASHFAIASLQAKLGTPEIDLGLFPMMIMAQLRRHVPRRQLVQMMLFGEKLDAARAAELGLVNRAVPPEQLDAAVAEVVAKIAEKSPIAVRLGLQAMAAQDDRPLEDALPLLRERLLACLSTEDAREGLMAFVEKRKPVWGGK